MSKRKLTRSTLYAVWVAREVGQAVADAPVAPGRAVGVAGALTRIHALLIATGQVLGAVIVNYTFGAPAVDPRIAAESLRAVADGNVRVHRAHSVGRAVRVAAGVLAVGPVTGLRHRAVAIVVAASYNDAQRSKTGTWTES